MISNNNSTYLIFTHNNHKLYVQYYTEIFIITKELRMDHYNVSFTTNITIIIITNNYND